MAGPARHSEPTTRAPVRAPAGSAAAATPDEGKRYYRIGEVARITGIKPYVLRYWESEFRWMAPQKSRSQQRLYRKRDIDVIQLIKRLLYEERFTIAGARRKLRELGVSRALELPQLGLEIRAEPGGEASGLDASRERLRRIRDELAAIRAGL